MAAAAVATLLTVDAGQSPLGGSHKDVFELSSGSHAGKISRSKSARSWPIKVHVKDAEDASPGELESRSSSRNPSTTAPSGTTSAATGVLKRSNQQRLASRRMSSVSHLTIGEEYFPRISRIVKSKRFEVVMGLIIAVNCFTMGLEAELLLGNAESYRSLVQVSEHIITAIFLTEFLMRLLVHGWRFFAPLPGTIWNFLDAALVLVTGVLVVWILPLIGVQSAGSSLQVLTVLRALRLARLVRVVQRFQAFHEVWLLLRGLMESGRVLFWTVVVIFFITYLFAVFGVVLLGVQIKEEYQDAAATSEGVSRDLEDLADYTCGVLPLMYTLIQVLTLDSWNSIARPMMKYITGSWVFFYLYIAIAVIVMMNLVTAVIVENALKNSQKDANDMLKEKERQKNIELQRFRQIFEDMDEDGDGELTWPEFKSAFEDKELSAQLRLLGIEPGNCREIFNLLDTGDGVLSVQEFFHGVSCMEGQAKAKDLLRTNKTIDLVVKLLCQQNQELREDLDELLRLTPGARIRQRKGSLQARARRQQTQEDIFHTHESGGTPSPSPCGAKQLHDFHQAEHASMTQVMKRLEQVAEMVEESRHEHKQTLAACAQTIQACNRNMTSMGLSRESCCTLPYDDMPSLLPRTPPAHPHRHNDRLNPEVPPAPKTPAPTSQWRAGLLSDRRPLPPAPAMPPFEIPISPGAPLPVPSQN